MVLLAILDYADGGDAQTMVSQGRYHHQYVPDAVQFEPQTFSDDEIGQLRAMGHHIKPLTRRYGNMQVVLWDRARNRVTAASDPRGNGKSEIR
jgi:gamma-glutamyltranspeptidase/glutathione hydrolase